MTEITALSLDSQARLANLSILLAEFFESFDRFTRELTELRTQVASLDSRIRLIELEHAID